MSAALKAVATLVTATRETATSGPTGSKSQPPGTGAQPSVQEEKAQEEKAQEEKAQEEKELVAILETTVNDDQPVGSPVTVDVRMVNQEGRTIPNMVLLVSLNGVQIRRARTDDDGRVSIYLGRDVPVGTHSVRVDFIGTRAYPATSVTETVTVRPIILVVKAVPPLPGVEFSLAGQSAVTGTDGSVRFEVNQRGTYPLNIVSLPESEPEAPVRIEFARWDDSVYTPDREVEVYRDRQLLVGFEQSYLIDLTFVDLAGNPVDPARITSITLKSSIGTRYVYEKAEPQWRKAARIVRLKNGLEISPIQYGVESIIIDGTNVVNQNQQRFLVRGQETWPIQLLLYAMRLGGVDAVFGFPVGSGIDLTYPDGRVEPFPFDENNEVLIQSLARGIYKVQVKDASGMAPLTPVALSRDQTAQLKVLSTLDMAVGLALGTLLATGLLLYGRPQIVIIPYRLVRGWFRPQESMPGYKV